MRQKKPRPPCESGWQTHPVKKLFHVFAHPPTCDLDYSGTIDLIEALLLGVALSLDSLGVGLGTALSGFSTSFLPFGIALCQGLLLYLGTICGKRLPLFHKIDQRLTGIIPGLILVALAIIRLF